jgi:hypothetical protein
MNYIAEHLSNLLNMEKPNLIFPSSQSTQVQDPLSKLIKWLDTERGVGIKIKNEEEILIEDFLYTDKNKTIQLNLDEDRNNIGKQVSFFKTNRRNPTFPTEKQKTILTRLKRIPVYTVVNGNNEIILASPREETNKSSLQWFYNQYHNWFIWDEDEGPITIGLFFFHKQDAESYLHEICLKDARGAQNSGLSIKSTGLDTFYYLNRTSDPKIQIRIIGDLEELDILLKINLKKNTSFINPKQKYGSNWFKGTPIYILRTNNSLINKRENHEINKQLVFFSREDIEKVLEISKNNNKESTIEEPIIEIYNLENYLLDLEKSSYEMVQKIRFFPTYTLYQKIGDNPKINNRDLTGDKKIKKILIEKVKSTQRFCKGVIWLVTSDTLPSEENSW